MNENQFLIVLVLVNNNDNDLLLWFALFKGKIAQKS